MKKGASLTLLTLLQMVFTLCYQLYIAVIFDLGDELDVYFASATLSLILAAVATSGINYSITPHLVSLIKNHGNKAFWEFAYRALNSIIVVAAVLTLSQVLLANPILKLIFGSLLEEYSVLLEDMFRLHAVGSFFSLVVGCIIAINYAIDSFYRTILIPIAGSIVQFISTFLLHDALGVFSLALSFLISQIFIACILFLPILTGYRWVVLSANERKDFWFRTWPLFLSSTASKSDLFLDRMLVSGLAAGSISVLHYGQLIINTLSTLLSKAVAITSLRSFSWLTDRKEKLERDLLFYIVILLKVCLIVTYNIIFFSGPTISYFLGEVLEIEGPIDQLSVIVRLYLGVLFGGVVASVLVNAFYANKRTALVAAYSSFLHIVFIPIKLVGFVGFGLLSLPFLMSIKGISNIFLLLWLYHTHYKWINLRIYALEAIFSLLYFTIFCFITLLFFDVNYHVFSLLILFNVTILLLFYIDVKRFRSKVYI